MWTSHSTEKHTGSFSYLAHTIRNSPTIEANNAHRTASITSGLNCTTSDKSIPVQLDTFEDALILRRLRPDMHIAQQS